MNIVIYITEGESLDAKQKPSRNKGEIGKDYIRKHDWVVGSQILTEIKIQEISCPDTYITLC